MKICNKILLILFLLILTKCEGDTYNKIDFTENVTIALAEKFFDFQRKEFFVNFLPKQNCHCMNDGQLDYSFAIDDNTFDFNLKGIQIPEDCKDSYGCPYAQTNIGALANGTYNINVNIGSSKNKGVLSVTDTAFCLTMTKIENLELIWGHFRRVFDNTLWGGFCYSTDTELEMGLSLLDSLNTLGVQPTTLEYGDYFFFTFFNGKPDLRMYGYVPHYYANKEIGFIYNYNFSDEKIKNLMDKFKNLSENLYIKIATGKGSSFYNWR